MNLSLVIVLLALLSPRSFATGPDTPATELPRELELTPEQKEKLHTLREDHKTKRDALLAVVEKSKAEFDTAMENPKTPEAELTKKFEALEKSQLELRRSQFKHRLAVRSLLTEQQRERLSEKRKQGPGKAGVPRAKSGKRLSEDKKAKLRKLKKTPPSP